MMATDLHDSVTRERLSTPAVALVTRITELWELSPAQTRLLLGGISSQTWRRWREGSPVLSQDTLTRISLLIGIHRALRTLFGPSLGDAWPGIPNSNPVFAGRRPIDTMISEGIPRMVAVRELLEGWQHEGA